MRVPRSRRPVRGLGAFVSGVSGVSALLLAGCGGGAQASAAKAPAPAAAGPPTAVHVATAARAPWARTLEVTGALVAFEEATVAAEVAGRVLAAEVDVGSSAEAGRALVRLDPTDLRLAVDRAEAALIEARARLGIPSDVEIDDPEQGPDERGSVDDVAVVKVARAQLDQAEADHKRVVALRAQRINSPADLDAAEAAVRAARSRVDEARDEVRARWALLAQRRVELRTARERLRRADVLAPFAGAVRERLVSPGDYVQVGTPVARVVRVDPLRVRAEVPERQAGRVRHGQRLLVHLEGRAAPLETTVARLSPALSDSGRVLVIEGDLPNAGGELRAGTFARIEVVVEPEAATLVVPPAAIRTFAGLDKVLLVEGGAAVERRVTLGRRAPDRVEVLEGLAEGAQVVLDPGALRTGQPITVEE